MNTTTRSLPARNVEFAYVGTNPFVLGWGTTDDTGYAALTTTALLPVGIDPIEAGYPGDGYYEPSISNVNFVEVDPIVTISAPSSVNEGSSVAVSAIVGGGTDPDSLTYSWVATNGEDRQTGSGAAWAFTAQEEGNYTVTLTASLDGASSTPATTVTAVPPTATIVADDPGMALGGDPITFHVELSFAVNEPVMVEYQTADGTGTAGEDYVATTDTITVDANQTSSLNNTVNPQTFTVSTIDVPTDTENETFFVQAVASSSNEYVSGGSATGTVIPWSDWSIYSIEFTYIGELHSELQFVQNSNIIGPDAPVLWTQITGASLVGGVLMLSGIGPPPPPSSCAQVTIEGPQYGPQTVTISPLFPSLPPTITINSYTGMSPGVYSFQF